MPYVFFACPARKHAWPKVAACWSPAIAGDRDRPAEQLRVGLAEHARRGPHLRQHRSRHAISSSSSSSHASGGCRTASVRLAFETSVACTRPAGQPPEQERVDRAEASSPRSARARSAGHGVEDVRDLRAREVRVERQPGLRPNSWLVARGAQLVADRRGDPALPHDRIGDRHARSRDPRPWSSRAGWSRRSRRSGRRRRRSRSPRARPRAATTRSPRDRGSTWPGDGKSAGTPAARRDAAARRARRRSRATTWCPGRGPG